MKKINLLLHHQNYTSFHQPAIQNICKDYFNFLYLDQDVSYDKADTILVSNLTEDKWYTDLHQEGYKLIMDLLWGGSPWISNNMLCLTADNFFWYHDALLYKSKGLDQYIPDRKYTKLAFMPMGNIHSNRDKLFDLMLDQLDNFIWSYVERTGKRLPGDCQKKFKDSHYFNPSWYDNTYFSLISETEVKNGILFSEKTFKPLAFQHPFLIWGTAGLLGQLHQRGFETFENLFDESYDSDVNQKTRLDAIVNNVISFKPVPYDQLTNEKLQHNHQRFFDDFLIKSGFVNDIVYPILDFFESRQ